MSPSNLNHITRSQLIKICYYNLKKKKKWARWLDDTCKCLDETTHDRVSKLFEERHHDENMLLSIVLDRDNIATEKHNHGGTITTS